MPRRYLLSQVPVIKNCNLTTYKNKTFCRVGLSTRMMVDEIVVVTKKVRLFCAISIFIRINVVTLGVQFGLLAVLLWQA